MGKKRGGKKSLAIFRQSCDFKKNINRISLVLEANNYGK
jgi:hypothetical protein